MKTFFLTRQTIRRGDPDVAEDELRMSVLVLVSEDRQVPLDLQTWGITRHEDHRLLAVCGPVGGRLAHDNEDLAALVGGAADPPLPAVDDIVVAVPLDHRRNVAGI